MAEIEKEKLVKSLVDEFVVSDATLRQVSKILAEEMELGLSTDNKSNQSSLKMLPSYVCSVPTGKETGNFLALDLGGTHLRVILVKLQGKTTDMKTFKIYKIQKDIMTGSGEKLFDQIAGYVEQFISDNKLADQKLPLGFTFSFPLKQESLKCGRLISWTKGFSCSGVVGEDVVKLLQDAVARRKMIINMEWGALGDNGKLDMVINKYDKIVDSASINHGKQSFEKLISGMYMGEHLRLVILELAENGVIFHGKSLSQLAEKYTLSSKVISEVENDATEKDSNFSRTAKFFSKFNINDINKKDWEILHKICQAISLRSAYLCAAGIAGILNKMGRPQVTVAIDGAVYRFHPNFKINLESKLRELVDKNIQFKLKSADDGSGRGAAIVAAVAKKTEK